MKKIHLKGESIAPPKWIYKKTEYSKLKQKLNILNILNTKIIMYLVYHYYFELTTPKINFIFSKSFLVNVKSIKIYSRASSIALCLYPFMLASNW